MGDMRAIISKAHGRVESGVKLTMSGGDQGMVVPQCKFVSGYPTADGDSWTMITQVRKKWISLDFYLFTMEICESLFSYQFTLVAHWK